MKYIVKLNEKQIDYIIDIAEQQELYWGEALEDMEKSANRISNPNSKELALGIVKEYEERKEIWRTILEQIYKAIKDQQK